MTKIEVKCLGKMVNHNTSVSQNKAAMYLDFTEQFI